MWKPWSQSKRHWGLLVLGVWLILTGLVQFVSLEFQWRDELLGAMAIVAGILILLNR